MPMLLSFENILQGSLFYDIMYIYFNIINLLRHYIKNLILGGYKLVHIAGVLTKSSQFMIVPYLL